MARRGGEPRKKPRKRRERIPFKLGDRIVLYRLDVADVLGKSLAHVAELIKERPGRPTKLRSKKALGGSRVIMEDWLIDYMIAEGLLPADYKIDRKK
jgi:hypothetical protein